nr:MAG: capsid protein [Cressdnaviricota sp.]
MPRKYAGRKRPRFTRRRPTRGRRHHARSNKNTSTLRSQGLPKELFVKFPWYQEFDTGEISPSTSINYVFNGNSLIPYSGNAVSATVGNYIVPALQQYSSFYSESTVTSSSLKLQVIRTDSEAIPLTVTLNAIPYSTDNNQGSVDSGENTGFVRALNTYTAFDVNSKAAQPYCQVKRLNVDTSGHETCYMKRFGKVKKFLGISSIRDNHTMLSLPITNYIENPEDSSNSVIPQSGFFYILTISNTDPTNSASCSIQARMSIYTQLSTRSPLPLTQYPASASLTEEDEEDFTKVGGTPQGAPKADLTKSQLSEKLQTFIKTL